MGTKDFDKGLEFDAECGMCLLFQFVYSRFSGAGLGERGWGSPHPGSGPGGGALKPKEMTGSAVLQVTAGGPFAPGWGPAGRQHSERRFGPHLSTFHCPQTMKLHRALIPWEPGYPEPHPCEGNRVEQ